MDATQLAAQVRAAKRDMEHAKAAYAHRIGTYEELATAAKDYCEAFYAYQVARFGKTKAKRLDFRAVLR